MGYPSDMTYRRLGDSGLVVSAVGLGTNNFGMKLGMEECREVVDAAIDNGITLFDTSALARCWKVGGTTSSSRPSSVRTCAGAGCPTVSIGVREDRAGISGVRSSRP